MPRDDAKLRKMRSPVMQVVVCFSCVLFSFVSDKLLNSGIDPYMIMVSNKIVQNKTGNWYIGMRQLSPDEVDQYSSSNEPPVPTPFTGRFTTNFTLRMFKSGCHFTRSEATHWSGYGCEVSGKNRLKRHSDCVRSQRLSDGSLISTRAISPIAENFDAVCRTQ